jgi:hypothetical protein
MTHNILKPLSSPMLAATLYACVAVLSGCTADAAAGASTDLVRDDGGLPLLEETADTDAWWLAPPGCEGLIGGDGVAIAIASLEHGLVAAVDPSGDIVCVDTIEAVGEELDELGRHDDAVALSSRFEASEMAAQASEMAAQTMTIGGRYTGDPHPEPSDCITCGDPHPEPSRPSPEE